MRSLILGFVGGAWWLQQQARLPAEPMWVLLGLCSAWLVVWLWQRKRTANTSSDAATNVVTNAATDAAAMMAPNRAVATLRQICLHSLPLQAFPGMLLRIGYGAALGFYWAALLAVQALATRLPAELEGKNLQLLGVVTDLPYRFEGGTRFRLAPESLILDGKAQPLPAHFPSTLLLGWYEGGSVAAGERWRLTVRLQRPHGNANPYGFDYELWLLEQGVRATGYVREGVTADENVRLNSFVWQPSTVVAAVRDWLRQRIYAALPDAHYAGVLVALVLGDQRAISQADWTLFNQTGVGHLMSISGLHITMVAGLFGACLNFLWRRSFYSRAQLPLLIPAQQVAALATCLTAMLYVALTGFGIPAQRTLIMLSVVAAAICLDRISSVSHVMCVALALVVVFDPWAVMWPGFWLSFGAVALILYASTGRTEIVRRRWLQEFRAAVRTQYIVTLGLLPLSLLLFSQYSLVSPLANALAIPVVSFVVTPLALLGSILPAPFSAAVLWLAHAVLAWLVEVLGKLAVVGVWSAPQPDGWMFLLALGGIVWMLAPRGWPARWLGTALCLPLLLNRPSQPAPGEFRTTVFDVGQGTAVLLETAGHRLLYDSGPQYSLYSDGGNRVILPYLKTRGIERLDRMVISHRDNDHAGGALSILQALPVTSMLSSLEMTHPAVLAATSSRHQRCAAGQQWEWDGVRFEMLHPQPESYQEPGLKSNAMSCTLKVSNPAGALLLPGDIEKAQEQELIRQHGAHLASTILLAPHHGSGTSSTPAFLQVVAPKLALFQVGYHNRYHHPKPEVYARYGEMGIERMRTDESGALEMQFGGGVTISAWRQSHARYWYGQ